MNGTRGGTAPPAEPQSLRVPPHSLEAEQGILAAVLLNNDLMDGVLELLRPEDFYIGAHRVIFSVMTDLYRAGRAIDQVTLGQFLKDRGVEGEVGGLSYLSDLLQNVIVTANVSSYAKLVKEKAVLRRAIAAAQQIATEAFQGVADLGAFLDQAEASVFSLAEEKIRPSYYSMADMAKESMKEIERLFTNKQMITGVPSGFRDLDQVTSGFQKGNLVIVAARPGMGKTSFSLNVAMHAALHANVPVAVFTLEMSRQEIALRMICQEARVNSQRLRTGALNQDEMNRLVGAVMKVSGAPVFIDDSGTLTALEVRAKARRLKKEKGIGLVIVDYLQLMRGTSTRANADNRVVEVSEISRSLKALAKELEIPVIAISQLSRAVESRSDKRPVMADLRESGAIEQDADLIVFIYREEAYARDKTPKEEKGLAEVLIGKNRNGPTRDLQLVFLSQYTRFENMAREEF